METKFGKDKRKCIIEMSTKLKNKTWVILPIIFILLGIYYAINLYRGYNPVFDIVIRNGRIIDGTGNPWYRADLGIKDGKITEIGVLTAMKARKIIDAGGMYVAPGFIDIHTHVDRKIDSYPGVINYVRQGVTTVVGGNCGGSQFPMQGFLHKLEEKGIAPNFASLIGHNTIRREIMGDYDCFR